MPPQSPTLEPPPQISDVAPTTGERVIKGLGGFIAGGSGASTATLDDAIAKEHQRRLDSAKMYRQLSATIAAQIATGFDAKTGQPLTPEQEQELQHQYEASWAAYEKAAGVSKETKGALQRGKAIVEHLIGVGRQNRQQQQPQGGGPPQADVTQGEGSAQAGMAPPPKFDVNQAALAAPVRQAQTEEGLREQSAGRSAQAGFEQRRGWLKAIGGDESNPAAQEFLLTGKMPLASIHLQTSPVELPDGSIVEGNFNNTTGKWSDDQGNELPGAKKINPSALQPKRFTYIGPNNEPLIGMQIGTKFEDQEGNPLPPDTQVYVRGAVPTETLRQQITYDAQGNPQINTLETIRTPFKLGVKPPSVGGAGPKGRTGGMTPPPKAGGAPGAPGGQTSQNVDAAGKPLGFSASAQKNAAQKTTAVKEGIYQIFGDPGNPSLKPLKDFSYLADDKASQDRIAKAWQLIVDNTGMEDPEKSGKTMTLLQAYTGFPQALASAWAGVKQKVQSDMRPDELEALDATVTAFSTAVALRSLTSASAAQFSVKALERDVPIIGLTATSKGQFNDKLSRLGELANNGLKVLPDAFFQAPETKDALRERMGVHTPATPTTKKESAPAKRSKMSAPPKANESPDDEIRRLSKEMSGRP